MPLDALEPAVDLEYPTSDGKPMAETEWHLWNMIWTIQTLASWFEKKTRVYVGGDMLLYYEEGHPRKHVAPDVFVVRGVSKRRRGNYKLWEEGKAPSAIIEFTSRSTRREDLQVKFKIYEQVLKVPEYFLFDPHGEHLKERLTGFRLLRGAYAPIELIDGRLPSKELGLHLEHREWVLRLFDPTAGSLLPLPAEEAERAKAEAERLRREVEALKRGRK